MSRRTELWQQLLQLRNTTMHHLRALLGTWPGLLTMTLLLLALTVGATFLARSSDDAMAQSAVPATLAQLATRIPTLQVTVVATVDATATKRATTTATATATQSPTPTWTPQGKPQSTATQVAASPLLAEFRLGNRGTPTPLAPLPANPTVPEITGPQIVPVDVITATQTISATSATSTTLMPAITQATTPTVTASVDAPQLLVPTPTATPSIVEALEKPVAVGGLAGMVATATAIAPVSAESAAELPAVAEAEPQPTPVSQPTPDGNVRTVQVPILMYHYLSAPPANADIYRQDLSVTPELFAAQLDAMQQAGYTTISLYALLDNLTHGTPLPDKPVVLTFDDGYRDNYENAVPLLRDRGLTATFFLVTDFINTERPEYVTWDMVREMYAAGMSIEGHGRNHVSLANKDNDYLIWQALGTYESIELEVGARPHFISYPAGEYDQRTIDIFRSANYWAGFTTKQGATHSSDDPFQMRRIRVRGTTSPEELLRLLALDW